MEEQSVMKWMEAKLGAAAARLKLLCPFLILTFLFAVFYFSTAPLE